MSSKLKCDNCGSSDVEVNSTSADVVCKNCGSVIEDTLCVAEVQFEEGAHGSSNAIGQFVSADSKGGATKLGASFHVGLGVESREITLRKARHGIQLLCTQLGLKQHCVDTACGFFKMALSANLTRGRRNTHVHAACVYLTCRTEGTAHLLIDISDILQISCFDLGKTYLKLAQNLCINIPAMDPCLYILRFASELEFGAKTQQVANTALRLVQRMKRDSIHSGRKPAGLCGAALLIAARLHEFGRTSNDIIKIVKIHESTLRKRLIEFGDTPSSSLTLEQFMTVDLDEDQDPPSFKAARKKDKERLQRLMEEEADSITELQRQIEGQLERDREKRPVLPLKFLGTDNDEAAAEAAIFIEQSTLGVIDDILASGTTEDDSPVVELGPDIKSMGLAKSLHDTSNASITTETLDLNFEFDDIDDAEIDMYIMTENEYQHKNGLWHQRNAAYLEEQKNREERLKKEKEEGKPEKKKKKTSKKKMYSASSASEAIEKIIQEKKISQKINYDVLKCLNVNKIPGPEAIVENSVPCAPETPPKRRRLSSVSSTCSERSTTSQRWRPSVEAAITKRNKAMGLPVVPVEVKDKEEPNITSEEELEDDYYENTQSEQNEVGMLQMLRQHRQDNDDDFEEPYYEYGD